MYDGMGPCVLGLVVVPWRTWGCGSRSAWPYMERSWCQPIARTTTSYGRSRGWPPSTRSIISFCTQYRPEPYEAIRGTPYHTPAHGWSVRTVLLTPRPRLLTPNGVYLIHTRQVLPRVRFWAHTLAFGHVTGQRCRSRRRVRALLRSCPSDLPARWGSPGRRARQRAARASRRQWAGRAQPLCLPASVPSRICKHGTVQYPRRLERKSTSIASGSVLPSTTATSCARAHEFGRSYAHTWRFTPSACTWTISIGYRC